MPARLTERFQPHDRVEIRFGASPQWWPAVVLRAEPPGVWVVTGDGRAWFVTNGRRIRPRAGPAPETDPTDE